MSSVLSQDQLETYLKDGVLVVENVLSKEEVTMASECMSNTLQRCCGVETSRLEETGHGLRNLSSTNGSGGVLDVFYENWKLEIASNAKLFAITCELWEAAYCHNGESIGDLDPADRHRWHPYGPFDRKKGFMYIDRLGYRLPTTLALKIGSKIQQNKGRQRKYRSQAIQRSLTPHLDCCPSTFHDERVSKWRPIQCFVSLSDTLEPNNGGFEAAKGFHREFDSWRGNRPPTTIDKKEKGNKKPETVSFPAPCVGEYTHIRPQEDAEIMKRVQHVSVKAGSAVFWDNRIPHANSYKHNGDCPRSVVYCSFLPDVPVNREFAAEQLAKWQAGKTPNDQWIGEETSSDLDDKTELKLSILRLSNLAKKLLMLEEW